MYIAEKEFERNDGHFSPILVHLHNWRHGDTLQWHVSPALWAHLLASPRISHRRVFPLKWVCYLGYSSGRSPYFLPYSVVLARLCTYRMTNRTICFIWDCWVFLTSINTKPPYHYCLEDQNFNGMLQSAAPKTPQAIHWLALDYFGGKLRKLANPYEGHFFNSSARYEKTEHQLLQLRVKTQKSSSLLLQRG